MIDLDDLLWAVMNDPADDVARLVYADRLDESGVEMNSVRAEFIRLQIADADPERQRELAAEWLADWFGKSVGPAGGGRRWAIGPSHEPGSVIVTLSRGFISAVGTNGVHHGVWTQWTPWRVAEAFANTVADVCASQPVEWVELDHYGTPESWSLGRPREGVWSASRRNGNTTQVLCESFISRTHFTEELCGALCRHAAVLVAQPQSEFARYPRVFLRE